MILVIRKRTRRRIGVTQTGMGRAVERTVMVVMRTLIGTTGTMLRRAPTTMRRPTWSCSTTSPSSVVVVTPSRA